MSTTEIFQQALDPFIECLTPDAARKIVALRADPDDQARLDGLGEKANDGSMTPEEMAEYEKFRAIFHMMTLLQSKARQLLNANSPAE
jgi:hypothetical protein